MGTLSNLFELVRDSSYRDIEEEASREVAIALAGNSLEARDQLHKALSLPMESLWSANPLRLVDTSEHPSADGESGGLLLYAISEYDRIPDNKRSWLEQVAAAPNTSIIMVVLPRSKAKEEAPARERNLGRRLKGLNPLKLVGGNGSETGVPTGVGADGATFNTASAETRPAWEVELEELQQGSNGKISVVYLSGLELKWLERELLAVMVKKLPGRELALAKRAPVFRNVVANHFVNNTARSNAELVLLANLTSGLPFVGDLFGGGADFVLLTKNQFELSHRLASVYGQKRAGWVELYLELAPIIGSAFIWRSIARTLTKKLPAIFALLPKGAIAYAATLMVGKAAQRYYANDRKGPGEVANFARNLFEQLTGWGQKAPGEAQNDATRHLKSS